MHKRKEQVKSANMLISINKFCETQTTISLKLSTYMPHPQKNAENAKPIKANKKSNLFKNKLLSSDDPQFPELFYSDLSKQELNEDLSIIEGVEDDTENAQEIIESLSKRDGLRSSKRKDEGSFKKPTTRGKSRVGKQQCQNDIKAEESEDEEIDPFIIVENFRSKHERQVNQANSKSEQKKAKFEKKKKLQLQQSQRRQRFQQDSCQSKSHLMQSETQAAQIQQKEQTKSRPTNRRKLRDNTNNLSKIQEIEKSEADRKIKAHIEQINRKCEEEEQRRKKQIKKKSDDRQGYQKDSKREQVYLQKKDTISAFNGLEIMNVTLKQKKQPKIVPTTQITYIQKENENHNQMFLENRSRLLSNYHKQYNHLNDSNLSINSGHNKSKAKRLQILNRYHYNPFEEGDGQDLCEVWKKLMQKPLSKLQQETYNIDFNGELINEFFQDLNEKLNGSETEEKKEQQFVEDNMQLKRQQTEIKNEVVNHNHMINFTHGVKHQDIYESDYLFEKEESNRSKNIDNFFDQDQLDPNKVKSQAEVELKMYDYLEINRFEEDDIDYYLS